MNTTKHSASAIWTKENRNKRRRNKKFKSVRTIAPSIPPGCATKEKNENFSFYACETTTQKTRVSAFPIGPLLSMDLPTFWLIYNILNKSKTNKALNRWSLHLTHSSSKKIHQRAFHVFERLHSNGNGIFFSILFFCCSCWFVYNQELSV